MKRVILAAAVATGLLGIVGTADAQRGRRGVVYTYPTYSSPNYTYSTPLYTSPTYSSGTVITSSYTPMYTSGGVITTSDYTSPWSGNTYYNTYPAGYYNTYPTYSSPVYAPGLNVTPSGAYYNGIRLWRR
jgi:hypothetical protein